MNSDPYRDVIMLSLILMAVMLVFVLLWMLARKYALRNFHSSRWSGAVEDEVLVFTPLETASPSSVVQTPSPSSPVRLQAASADNPSLVRRSITGTTRQVSRAMERGVMRPGATIPQAFSSAADPLQAVREDAVPSSPSVHEPLKSDAKRADVMATVAVPTSGVGSVKSKKPSPERSVRTQGDPVKPKDDKGGAEMTGERVQPPEKDGSFKDVPQVEMRGAVATSGASAQPCGEKDECNDVRTSRHRTTTKGHPFQKASKRQSGAGASSPPLTNPIANSVASSPKRKHSSRHGSASSLAGGAGNRVPSSTSFPKEELSPSFAAHGPDHSQRRFLTDFLKAKIKDVSAQHGGVRSQTSSPQVGRTATNSTMTPKVSNASVPRKPSPVLGSSPLPPEASSPPLSDYIVLSGEDSPATPPPERFGPNKHSPGFPASDIISGQHTPCMSGTQFPRPSAIPRNTVGGDNQPPTAMLDNVAPASQPHSPSPTAKKNEDEPHHL